MKLELTLEEVNKVLAALGHMPFDAVAELVVKIRVQAHEQLQAQPPAQEVTEESEA